MKIPNQGFKHSDITERTLKRDNLTINEIIPQMAGIQQGIVITTHTITIKITIINIEICEEEDTIRIMIPACIHRLSIDIRINITINSSVSRRVIINDLFRMLINIQNRRIKLIIKIILKIAIIQVIKGITKRRLKDMMVQIAIVKTVILDLTHLKDSSILVRLIQNTTENKKLSTKKNSVIKIKLFHFLDVVRPKLIVLLFSFVIKSKFSLVNSIHMLSD